MKTTNRFILMCFMTGNLSVRVPGMAMVLALVALMSTSIQNLHADSATVIKLATMAPQESTWGKALADFAEELKEKTKGQLLIKIYYGGVAGDETSVLRKIRIKKLQGGVFTGKALGEIYGDVRVMEIPFSFPEGRARAWDTLQAGKDFFNKGFIGRGFTNLGFFEIGPVYLASKYKLEGLQDLKGKKIWTWTGDQVSQTIVESLNLVGVPLGLEAVHTALSTGMIDTVYNAPLGLLVMQWHTKVNYIIDYPVTFSIGALLIKNETLKALKDSDRKILTELMDKHVALANAETIKKNEESIAEMKKAGIQFTAFPKKDEEEGKKIRQTVIDKLKGKMFSQGALDFIQK